MLRVFVDGIGIKGPGLADWPAASDILAGRKAYEPASFAAPAIDLLPPAERRRISATIKLALSIAREAVLASGCDPATLAAVFASSGGDGDTIHNILETLATPAREVSPTRFHNSVHNAPSGYWALATECREPSTTICAHDGSFGAGLLEAAAQVTADERPVLLAAYDKAYPEPLHAARPILEGFGAALVLAPARTAHSLVRMDIALRYDGPAESRMDEGDLERLRRGNPAARGLPLLGAIATGGSEPIIIENAPGMALALTLLPAGAP
jgi:Beta-ketoacyl synthase, N-terminal domain